MNPLLIRIIISFVLLIDFSNCKETVAERGNDATCDLKLIKKVIGNEMESVVPAISFRLWEPLSSLKVEIKSKLRKLLSYVRGKAEDTQAVGDNLHKGGHPNSKSGTPIDGALHGLDSPLVDDEGGNKVNLEEIVRKVEETVANSTFRVEEAVKELTENFSLLLNMAFSDVFQKIVNINSRLQAIEQSIECSKEAPDHY